MSKIAVSVLGIITEWQVYNLSVTNLLASQLVCLYSADCNCMHGSFYATFLFIYFVLAPCALNAFDNLEGAYPLSYVFRTSLCTWQGLEAFMTYHCEIHRQAATLSLQETILATSFISYLLMMKRNKDNVCSVLMSIAEMIADLYMHAQLD